MNSAKFLFVPLFFILLIVHTQSHPLNNSDQGLPSSHRRQDIGGADDPLIPGADDSETTESPLPSLIGRARQGLEKFRESTADWWEGVRDRVSDFFDTD